MNKRIYFQNRFLDFSDSLTQTQHNQVIKWGEELKSPKDVFKILNAFLSEETRSSYHLPAKSFQYFLETVKKELQYIEAAGGFIENQGRYLCIHRLGRWDLPKGKLEKKETIEAAAIRECEEECGIGELSITHPLSSTFHIYPYKNGMAIKQSFWFYMHSTWDKALVAQTEENIDEVRWFDKEEILSRVLPDTYYTIHDVITEALQIT